MTHICPYDVALSLPCFMGVIAVRITEGQSLASRRDMAYGTQRQFDNAEQSELPPRSKKIFRGAWKTPYHLQRIFNDEWY